MPNPLTWGEIMRQWIGELMPNAWIGDVHRVADGLAARLTVADVEPPDVDLELPRKQAAATKRVLRQWAERSDEQRK